MKRLNSIRNEVTKKGAFAVFKQGEAGKPRNQSVRQAAVDALSETVLTPIGDATYFFERVSNYDLWYESAKCHYIKEAEKNMFYVEEDYSYVHNKSSNKTNDAVVIWSDPQRKWLKEG